MSALLSALYRLLMPLIREWWKKSNWSAHSIQNLKEIHYIFIAGLIQFSVFLYVVDHGLTMYLYYSDMAHKAALAASGVEPLIASNKTLTDRNDRLEEQVKSANELIAELIRNNPSLAPKRSPSDTSVTDSADTSGRLDALKQRYKGE